VALLGREAMVDPVIAIELELWTEEEEPLVRDVGESFPGKRIVEYQRMMMLVIRI